MSPAATLPERNLADTLAAIVGDLLGTVASKLNRRPWLGPLILLLHRQLARKIRLFAALHQRFQAGTLPPLRPRAPRPPRPRAPPRPRLPHGAWLIPLVREVAGYRSQLEHLLLTDPELPDLLAAAPRAGRLLRPICRMLAIDLPPILRPPPRPKPAPQAEAAEPAVENPAAHATEPRPVRRRAPSRAAILRELIPGFRLSARRCR